MHADLVVLGSTGSCNRVAPTVETNMLALGLLLVSDEIRFISEAAVAKDLDTGVPRSIPVRAPYLSDAVGMTLP